MPKRIEGIDIPKLKNKEVADLLVDWLASGPSVEAEVSLMQIERQGGGLKAIEADLSLAFLDLVRRLRGHATKELPRLVAATVKGEESATNHVRLTAANATDVAAMNLARSALDYTEKLQRWDDIK